CIGLTKGVLPHKSMLSAAPIAGAFGEIVEQKWRGEKDIDWSTVLDKAVRQTAITLFFPLGWDRTVTNTLTHLAISAFLDKLIDSGITIGVNVLDYLWRTLSPNIGNFFQSEEIFPQIG